MARGPPPSGLGNPNSVDEWFQLVQRHERAAKILCEDKRAAAEGYFHAGIAIECAIKAYIMHTRRMNRWPDRDEQLDLYTHNIERLGDAAGLQIAPTDRVAAAWLTAISFQRGDAYDPKPMPRKVARDMYAAAFGPDGVVKWIRGLLPKNI